VAPTDMPDEGQPAHSADVVPNAGGGLGQRSGGESAPRRGTAKFRKDIHGLRAVAVALVVLDHTNVPGLSGGYVGVDVFFVISGFVITGVLMRESYSSAPMILVRFYARRVRRILPAAGVVAVLTVIATYGILGFIRGYATGRDAVSVAFFIANYHFIDIGTDYALARTPPSLLQNYWSLAVEEQFYLVFPAVCLLAARLGRKYRFETKLTTALVVITAGSYLWSILLTSTNGTAAFFSSTARACELGVGCLTFLLGSRARRRLRVEFACVIGWLGVGLIAFSATQFDSRTHFPGALVAVPVVGTALVIISGPFPGPAGVARLLRTRCFQWIGSLSYSIYLIHWPVLTIADQNSATQLSGLERAGLVALTVVLSWLMYVLVEKPVRNSRYLARRPGLSLCIFPVFVIAILAVVLYQQSRFGLPISIF
jgi:peptidoglycan/LPS O-acetylase OafA/YrhL